MSTYTYIIVLKNKSGSNQTYTVFQERLHISSEIFKQEIPHLAGVTVQAKVPNGQTASFSIFRTYYAICGSSQSSQPSAADVLVFEEKPVSLGTVAAGVERPGSTLAVKVIDGTLQFEDRELQAGGHTNSFEIRTSTDFDQREANEKKLKVGLGAGGADISQGSNGPSAVSTPRPNESYQIQPKETFYLTFGSYTKDSVIDTSKAEKLLKISLNVLEEKVTVIHDASGGLDVQKS